ncbi:MAG TPA: L-arabinose ABC transporter ATP-binding protein AraG [Phycisphaerae bacterium]|nr:L-arabinose ABC transporter ATP-binding protein AraG [Phycisphaerae bacterium]
MTSSPAAPASDLLRFEAVTKTYPGVRALEGVSFSVAAGSVHALLGENGAGKSTLLKTLSGAHLPTSGNLVVDGKPVVFRSTTEALAAGVAVIYQELHLVPHLSVAENLYLGHLPTTVGVIRKSELYDLASRQLQRVGETFHPKTPLYRLSLGQRQMVEIAKALSWGARILAFDEPTSSLSAREITKLFEVIGDLKQQNCAILYVTHRMEEVFRICDAATVLRDGKHVVTYNSLESSSAQPGGKVTHDQIVKAMVGRELADIYAYRPRTPDAAAPPALEIQNLRGAGMKHAVSFKVAPGEILGLFGLVGAGRSETLKVIFGGNRKKQGRILVDGHDSDISNPRRAIHDGVLLCPEDRKKEGIVPVRSVLENINISARHRESLGGVIIRPRWEKQNALKRIKELAVKTPSPAQEIRFLSGGNQQKAILGRWLSEKIRVMLLDEPTRGIDVGAKAEIYNILYSLAERGIGVVVVSSDLPEVMGVSDRILVMREGQIALDVKRGQATPEQILAAALPLGGSAPADSSKGNPS